MKNRIVLILFILFFSHTLSAQIDTLLLPYDAASLTTEQQASNPSVLAYPTAIKDQIPQMICSPTFTIDAEGNKVIFSPGNLQYQASTGLWRFAEHQWDYVGDATDGTVYENGVKCNNSLIGSSYSGWIDLFAWGTSGWSRGYGGYSDPTSTAPITDMNPYNSRNYYIQNRPERNLDGTNADWGVYNQIGEDVPNTWRTLSSEQWDYILHLRPNATKLYGLSKVNGVSGFIILPDVWAPISGVSFIPTNEDENANVFTLIEWAKMERNGAVFLPLAGYRVEKNVRTYEGWYWSTTANTTKSITYGAVTYYTSAYCVHFGKGIVNYEYRSYGLSVRLVRDLDK